MPENRGKKIGEFSLEDDIDIEDIENVIELIDEDPHLMIEQKWSSGKLEIYQRKDHQLSDVE